MGAWMPRSEYLRLNPTQPNPKDLKPLAEIPEPFKGNESLVRVLQWCQNGHLQIAYLGLDLETISHAAETLKMNPTEIKGSRWYPA